MMLRMGNSPVCVGKNRNFFGKLLVDQSLCVVVVALAKMRQEFQSIISFPMVFFAFKKCGQLVPSAS